MSKRLISDVGSDVNLGLERSERSDVSRTSVSTPSLSSLCLSYLGDHLQSVYQLDQLPEYLATQVFLLVLNKGNLTYELALLFRSSRHSILADYIKQHVDLSAAILPASTGLCSGKSGYVSKIYVKVSWIDFFRLSTILLQIIVGNGKIK